MPKNLAVALLAVSASLSGTLSIPAAAQTIAAKTSGMKHFDGFLPMDWDAKTGQLFLEIPHLDTDLLYTNSLPYGTGSNDLGLDRGQTEGSAGRTQPALPLERDRPRRTPCRQTILSRVRPVWLQG
jgi:hypothetical protein